jgi:hypothetical protein
MPKIRAGYKQLATQIPDWLFREVERLAAALGRSMAEEVSHALARHVAQPPTLSVPKLKPEVADRRRDRRREEGSALSARASPPSSAFR